MQDTQLLREAVDKLRGEYIAYLDGLDGQKTASERFVEVPGSKIAVRNTRRNRRTLQRLERQRHTDG